MKPVDFPESNFTLGAIPMPGGAKCEDLKTFRSDDGFHISCWKAGWRDRLRILFSGQVWLWVWSGRSAPPVSVQAYRPDWKYGP